MHEDIPILNFLVPKEFKHAQRASDRHDVREGEGGIRRQAAAAGWCRPASRTSSSNATTCWSRSARRTPSPGSSATSAWNSTSGTCRWSTRSPCSPPTRRCSSAATRRSARRTSSGRWRTATRRRSPSTSCARARTCKDRPPPLVNLSSQKMGIHEWSYDNDISLDLRFKVPHRDKAMALRDIKAEVELGFDWQAGLRRGAALPELRRADGVHRQAVHRVRRLRRYLPGRLHHLHRATREEADLRTRLKAPAHNMTQALYVSGELKTGRVMVKDEDVCLHCGLCAERCPTGAWDMQRFLLDVAQAENACCKQLDRVERPPAGQRLRRQVRQRQRIRFGQRQHAVRQGGPAHGRAGDAAQHLPVQHPGPADLVRGARSRRPGISARAAAAST